MPSNFLRHFTPFELAALRANISIERYVVRDTVQQMGDSIHLFSSEVRHNGVEKLAHLDELEILLKEEEGFRVYIWPLVPDES